MIRSMAAAAALAVVLAGCGDDGDDSVSPEAFAEEVNDACAQQTARFGELTADFPAEPTPEQIQELAGEFRPVVEEYRAAVEDAGVPEGLEDEHSEYLDLLDQSIEDFREAEGDPEAAQALFESPGVDFAAVEEALGIGGCRNA
jgi:predicted small lipoprotein YifL